MRKNFLKISILSILLILVYSTVVSALSFTATMTPSSTTVAEATEFTVEIKVSNLDVGSNGINSLSGYLKYDNSVFETISDSSIEGLNSWDAAFNADSGKITLTKTTFVKSEEAVFQITFKTKSGVSGKSGAISYTNIMASNSAADIAASDISTSITVGNVAANTANSTSTNNQVPILSANTSNNANQTSNTAKNTTNNTAISSNTNSSYINTSNTSSTDDIPYTGVEDTVLYIMIIVLALAIIFYVKFEFINREIK